MAESSKPMSDRDAAQATQFAFNDVDKSVTTNGFLVGKVGHKIVQSITTTTVANDTLIFSYYDNATLLYTYTIIYTDASYSTMISAERTA